MTPQQQQQFELVQFLNKQKQRPLSYEEWLAQRGSGNPYTPAQPNYGDMMSRKVQSSVPDYLDEALFSAGNTGATAGTAGTTFSGGATVAGEAVGTAANGGTMMSTGVVVPASQGTPLASTAMGAETGILGNASAMGAGPIAGIIAGTVLGGRSALNMIKGKQKNWKDASLADNAGRATLAVATGGLSEVANKLLGGHRSTKDRQEGEWRQLNKEGKAPDSFLGAVNQDQGVDDNKIASGKLGGKDVWATSAFFKKFSQPDKTWDVTGTETQREQIAKEILDNKLLDTRKGLTRFTDESKVQEIYDRVLGNKPSTIGSQTPASVPLKIEGPAGFGAPGKWVDKNGNPVNSIDPGFAVGNKFVPDKVMIPRSKTRSPGIGLDGKPISYGKR